MKFLIVKTSSLGDIIQTFPAADYLRNRYPDCQIDWVVEKPFAELLQANPQINRTICVATKKWRRILPFVDNIKQIKQMLTELRAVKYNAVFDLQGNSKSGLITLAAYGEKKVGFGRKSVPEWPNLLATNVRFDVPEGDNIRRDYLAVVRAFFNDSTPYDPQGVILQVNNEEKARIRQILGDQIGKTILVCPGSMWRNKQVPEKTLQELLQAIYKNYHCRFLFLWGSKEEQECAERLQKGFENSKVVEKLPLAALQNLMHGVDLVLSMDSLPLHLAGTTNTPTFSIFGASLGSKYIPLGKANYYVQGACPYGQAFTKRCPALRKCATGACIRELSVEHLFQSFNLQCGEYLLHRAIAKGTQR